MASTVQSRWGRARIAFRRARICLWCLIIVLLASLLYFNRIGLPGFIKRPVLEKLREHGIDLHFTRLRLRWDHGLVAEHVLFGLPNDPAIPRLSVADVALRLDYSALARLHLQIESLLLRQGRLTWPVLASNAPPRELVVDNINTQLRFLPGDVWSLDQFQARFAGAQIQLSAHVTNASVIQNWKILQERPQVKTGLFQRRLNRLADVLEETHFSTVPRLQVDVRGDAADLHSFRVRERLNVPGAETPWGTIQNGAVSIQIKPDTNQPDASLAEIHLRAEGAQTRWAATTNLNLTLRLISRIRDPTTVQAALNLSAARTETKWGVAAATQVDVQWLHSVTNPIPLSGCGGCRFVDAEIRQGKAAGLRFAATFSAVTNAPAVDHSWCWWTNFAGYAATWELGVTELKSPRLQVKELLCRGQWHAPELQATQLVAGLYGGKLDARAGLNVSSRRLEFALASDFDAQGIAPLLTEKSRQWLAQFSWLAPPDVQGEGALILPAWTNRHPDWRLEVKPTVCLRGQFQIKDGAFRGVPLLTARSHFDYSNETWRLPDVVVTRPEGRLEMVHVSDERTRDFYFRVRSTVAPDAFRALLEPRQRHGLDLVSFTQPPLVEGEVWGRWHDPDRIGIKARVAVTNFTLRGESADGFQTSLQYTNRYLQLIEPRLQREKGTQLLAADSVSVNFTNRKVYVTNGVSTADPQAVTRAIGPRTAETFEPYRFIDPPVVHVEGIIPTLEPAEADLHFDVSGKRFAWWKLKATRIQGRVDWVDDRLSMRQLQADLYHGAATGEADFHFRPGQETEYRFNSILKNADLHLLMGDLVAATNHLEGLLNGRLNITRAETGNWQACQGKGRVNLRDGLIWQIPLFGILSPVLDGIMPGLGSSRAREGSASFSITNGVVYSDDLEIRASVMRLHYWGNATLKGKVDARVQAELLRDTWVVGRVLSLALWPVSKVFEYKISGTLRSPSIEPVFFIERIMLLPFHALRAFKQPLPEPSASPQQTNAPPALFP
jgi:hypothetical protein